MAPNSGAEDRRRLLSLAQDYAFQALAIDGNQARANWVLGWAHAFNREWEASHERFDRALALNANDYMVLNGAAWSHLIRGEIDASVQLMERSVALNPGDIANQGNFAQLLYWCEKWEDLKRQLNLLITLMPDNPGSYTMLARVASFLGDSEGVQANAAMAEARGAPYLALALSYGRIGDDVKARQMLAQWKASPQGSSSGASVQNSSERYSEHLVLKEYDSALDYLELAIDEGFPWDTARDVRFLSHHPAFDLVRDHPRFRELVRKSSLPFDRG